MSYPVAICVTWRNVVERWDCVHVACDTLIRKKRKMSGEIKTMPVLWKDRSSTSQPPFAAAFFDSANDERVFSRPLPEPNAEWEMISTRAEIGHLRVTQK